MASECELANISAITATSLRKHIATIAQLISMGDKDLEQLSAHLGHEKSTHLNYYRKTDDKLQIAKVSKLLLLMEKQSIGDYRGKGLDEIDLEIPDMEDTADSSNNTESFVPNKSTKNDTSRKNVSLEECSSSDEEIYDSSMPEVIKRCLIFPNSSIQVCFFRNAHKSMIM